MPKFDSYFCFTFNTYKTKTVAKKIEKKKKKEKKKRRRKKNQIVIKVKK